jgi:hypothetical protein
MGSSRGIIDKLKVCFDLQQVGFVEGLAMELERKNVMENSQV